MNECDECERYKFIPKNHTIACEYYHGGHCHAPDRGTMHPTFEISVWVRSINSEIIVTRNFENTIRLNPGERLEFWVNDHPVHSEESS